MPGEFISKRFLGIENPGVLLALIGTPVLVYLVVRARCAKRLRNRVLAVAREPAEFSDWTARASDQKCGEEVADLVPCAFP